MKTISDVKLYAIIRRLLEKIKKGNESIKSEVNEKIAGILPAVTADDFGKVLCVDEKGKWTGKSLPADDRIIETHLDNDGGWSYRRWESGLAECWRLVKVKATQFTETGSLYYSDPVFINYPFRFSSAAPLYRQITPASAHHIGMSIYQNSRLQLGLRIKSSQNTEDAMYAVVSVYVLGWYRDDTVSTETESVVTENDLPVVATSETRTLAFVDGDAASDYVEVGHNSGATNIDAIWSFTPGIRASQAEFILNWDNYYDGRSHGWAAEMEYVFAISSSKASGMTAASGAHIAKATVKLSGTDGTATVKFTGLNLLAGTTYYLRGNFNGVTTSTVKTFATNGNTVTLTT